MYVRTHARTHARTQARTHARTHAHTHTHTHTHSTKDVEKPYRWVLGDGTTIKGLELAIIGGDDVPPMLPGGVRRVIIPSSLGYEALAKPLAGPTT